ncbi:MAG: hypothetical protein IJM14_04710 [Lachnospiraceae bacterium]|nr:hypothetical protein [Lachnospiraceae bacterium]
MKKMIYGLFFVTIMMMLVACGSESKSSEKSTKEAVIITVYDKPYPEYEAFKGEKVIKKKPVKLNAEESEKIIKMIDSIKAWNSDALIDRIVGDIDAEMTIEGREETYYFSFDLGYVFKMADELYLGTSDDEFLPYIQELCKGIKDDQEEK